MSLHKSFYPLRLSPLRRANHVTPTIRQTYQHLPAQAPGEQFPDNKGRFWFLTLCGFQLLNAVLTAAVFNAGGQLQNAMGAIVLAVGALLGWLAIAFLHYSDSTDRRLARGVSLLD